MVLMWMEFRCETRFLAELPLPVVEWFPPGFIRCANAWQAFFSGFSTTDYADRTDPRKRAAGIFRSRLHWRAIDYFLSANLRAEAPAWDAAAVWDEAWVLAKPSASSLL